MYIFQVQNHQWFFLLSASLLSDWRSCSVIPIVRLEIVFSDTNCQSDCKLVFMELSSACIIALTEDKFCCFKLPTMQYSFFSCAFWSARLGSFRCSGRILLSCCPYRTSLTLGTTYTPPLLELENLHHPQKECTLCRHAVSMARVRTLYKRSEWCQDTEDTRCVLHKKNFLLKWHEMDSLGWRCATLTHRLLYKWTLHGKSPWITTNINTLQN